MGEIAEAIIIDIKFGLEFAMQARRERLGD